MSERLMLSCHTGLAPVDFPAEWTKGFDFSRSFAASDREAYIRFPSGEAFAVWLKPVGARGEIVPHTVSPTACARRLTEEESAAIEWGGFTLPWESGATAEMFGVRADIIQLDKIGGEEVEV